MRRGVLLVGFFLFLGTSLGLVPETQAAGNFGQFEVLDQILGSGSSKNIGDLVKPGAKPFTTIMNRIITIVTAITVIVGVGAIVWGGYLYMTAQGNANQVGNGKDYIKTALLAIALAVASVLILNTINPKLGEKIDEPVLSTPTPTP